MADYTFLDLIPGFHDKEVAGWADIGGVSLGHPVMNPTAPITMTHVFLGAGIAVVIILLALVARGKYSDRETALVPEGKISIRNFFEGIFDAVYNMMEGMMGEKQAKKHFGLIATLAVFILLSNLIGLVPGFIPPTQNLNTNVGPALVVFLVYNISGFMEQGPVDYIKHFMGPVLLLAPLLFFIELASHIARPVSLSLRLAGNMTGDHTVLGVFGGLATDIFGIPIGLTIPFYFLGLLVCIIQTLVFCLLSSVYISLAVAHEEH